MSTACVRAPRCVRFPPQLLRFTTAGRMACCRRPVRRFEIRAVQEDEEGVLVASEMFGQAAVCGVCDSCTEDTTHPSLEPAFRHAQAVGTDLPSVATVPQLQRVLQDRLCRGSGPPAFQTLNEWAPMDPRRRCRREEPWRAQSPAPSPCLGGCGACSASSSVRATAHKASKKRPQAAAPLPVLQRPPLRARPAGRRQSKSAARGQEKPGRTSSPSSTPSSRTVRGGDPGR